MTPWPPLPPPRVRALSAGQWQSLSVPILFRHYCIHQGKRE